MKPKLSVIIPAFNEAGRIGSTLRKVSAYLSARPYAYEIIVVDDGSKDRTSDVISGLRIKNLRIISSERNTGKGAAVREGMITAFGEMRLFMDADGSTDIGEIEKLEPYLKEGYDIAIGSRRAPGASVVIAQNTTREVLGAIYRKLVRTVLSNENEYDDTQNGFKLFSERATKAVFPDLQTAGWSFDVELLLLAKKEGLKIKEVPVVWANDQQSRMTFAGMLRMAIDLWRIKSRFPD